MRDEANEREGGGVVQRAERSVRAEGIDAY